MDQNMNRRFVNLDKKNQKNQKKPTKQKKRKPIKVNRG